MPPEPVADFVLAVATETSTAHSRKSHHAHPAVVTTAVASATEAASASEEESSSEDSSTQASMTVVATPVATHFGTGTKHRHTTTWTGPEYTSVWTETVHDAWGTNQVLTDGATIYPPVVPSGLWYTTIYLYYTVSAPAWGMQDSEIPHTVTSYSVGSTEWGDDDDSSTEAPTATATSPASAKPTTSLRLFNQIIATTPAAPVVTDASAVSEAVASSGVSVVTAAPANMTVPVNGTAASTVAVSSFVLANGTSSANATATTMVVVETVLVPTTSPAPFANSTSIDPAAVTSSAQASLGTGIPSASSAAGPFANARGVL